ncbi:MAG TPA: methyltransferase domain-containing protein [Abditibacteriaceae bacterium]|nr:methyltransferase domain-containing protein [Abditibacteriaceae bacterium]
MLRSDKFRKSYKQSSMRRKLAIHFRLQTVYVKSFFSLPQSNRTELLDLGRGSLREVRASLHDIRRINTYLGGTRVICNAVFALLQNYGIRRATILDVGTGSADIPMRLCREARRRNLEIQVLALDVNARHLRVAREDLGRAREKRVHLLQADAFSLPLRDESVDIVVSSLFLHHFRAPEIHQLLAEFERVSRLGWVGNDLVRHRVPLWFFRLTRPVFARSYITRHDGEASLRRGYTVEEMQNIVRQSPVLPVSQTPVRAHFPFRMSLLRDKSR